MPCCLQDIADTQDFADTAESLQKFCKFAALASKKSTMSKSHMWFQSWTASGYIQVLTLELWYDYNLDMHSICTLSVYKCDSFNRTLDKQIAFLQS